jgi:hypothetical protein
MEETHKTRKTTEQHTRNNNMNNIPSPAPTCNSGGTDNIRSIESMKQLWLNIVKLHNQLPSDCYHLFLTKQYDLEQDEHDELIQSIHGYIKQIELDVTRTCESINTQQSLKNILYALCMCYPDIGYCQGMSYVAYMLFEVYGCEEHVFYTMVTLLDKYQCRSLYKNNFPKLKQFTFVHEHVLRKRHRKLFLHLEKHGVISNMYLPNWLLTMFSLHFPLESSVYIFDTFLLDGWSAVHMFILQLFVHFKDQLLECRDMESIMQVIQGEMTSVSLLDLQKFSTKEKIVLDNDIKEAERLYKMKVQTKNQISVFQFRYPIY